MDIVDISSRRVTWSLCLHIVQGVVVSVYALEGQVDQRAPYDGCFVSIVSASGADSPAVLRALFAKPELWERVARLGSAVSDAVARLRASLTSKPVEDDPRFTISLNGAGGQVGELASQQTIGRGVGVSPLMLLAALPHRKRRRWIMAVERMQQERVVQQGGIPIEREEDWATTYPHEHCCFCRAPTPWWTALADREPGAQVACCGECAEQYRPEEVPSKLEWCNKERVIYLAEHAP